MSSAVEQEVEIPTAQIAEKFQILASSLQVRRPSPRPWKIALATAILTAAMLISAIFWYKHQENNIKPLGTPLVHVNNNHKISHMCQTNGALDVSCTAIKSPGGNQGQHSTKNELPFPDSLSSPLDMRKRATTPLSLDINDNLASGSKCAGATNRNSFHCKSNAILVADHELSDAYATAIHENVSREVLASYSQRWSDLREHASEDPAGTIEAYKTMAAELRARTTPIGQH